MKRRENLLEVVLKILFGIVFDFSDFVRLGRLLFLFWIIGNGFVVFEKKNESEKKKLGKLIYRKDFVIMWYVL